MLKPILCKKKANSNNKAKVYNNICLRASMSQFQKKGVVANTFAYYDTHKCAILKFQYNFIFQCVAAH